MKYLHTHPDTLPPGQSSTASSIEMCNMCGFSFMLLLHKQNDASIALSPLGANIDLLVPLPAWILSPFIPPRVVRLRRLLAREQNKKTNTAPNTDNCLANKPKHMRAVKQAGATQRCLFVRKMRSQWK